MSSVPESRSIGEATEADTKVALQNIDQTCYWSIFEQEYIYSIKAMVIARVDGIGTGHPYVYYALKYDNIFSMMRDWQEIRSVPESVTDMRRR